MGVNKRKVTAILACLLAPAAALAGANAEATFTLISAEQIAGVGPGHKVTLEIAASGLVGVGQFELFLALSPASAFDLAATAYTMPSSWIAPRPSVAATDTLRATLTTAATYTDQTEASIAVEKIAVGPAGAAGDLFAAAELGIRVTLNPTPTAVQEATQPTTTALAQNFPNPFNPNTHIRVTLGNSAPVTLTVYDVTGRTVQTLAKEQYMQAGTHDLIWDGRDATGQRVGSGVYFYQLQAGSFAAIKKMTRLR